MAYAKSVHYNHLVSWNIKGEGSAQQRKNTVSTYLGALKPSADILFLQEVQWVPSNLRSHLSALRGDHYELSQYSQEYDSCYNCVIFDKRKFEALSTELTTPLNNSFKLMEKWKEWEKKGFRSSQERQMRNRMCVVVLLDKSEGCKFIAASLHNLNNKEYSIKMAELFLQLLALVGETTGYPIVLAGDFNANLHKSSEVTRLGFILLEYKPTIHRLNRKSPIDVTIDFFLYRPGKNGSAVLHNVKAEVAHSDVVDSKGVVGDKKMDVLHKVSNHDPLRATLQLSSTAKVMAKPSSAPAYTSKKPSSSNGRARTVIKSTVKTLSTPAVTGSTCVKHEPTTSRPVPAAKTTTVKGKPTQPSAKPSASQTVKSTSSRSGSSAKTKQSTVVHKSGGKYV